MKLDYCKLCSNTMKLLLALRRSFWLYPSAADTLKHVAQFVFYPLSLPLILQNKTHKRKSSLPQTSPELTGAYWMLSAVQTQI